MSPSEITNPIALAPNENGLEELAAGELKRIIITMFNNLKAWVYPENKTKKKRELDE